MPAELTEQEYKAALKAKEDTNQSTIDNNATTRDMKNGKKNRISNHK